MTAEVVVRLRREGYLLAEASAGPSAFSDRQSGEHGSVNKNGMGIVSAARDAALGAFRLWSVGQHIEAEETNHWLIEIEVLGPPEPLTVAGDWTQPGVIDSLFEPGVHGMVLRGPRGQRRFCPTQTFTSDAIVADTLKSLAQAIHSDSAQVVNTELFRFRTVHWYEPRSGAEIVFLHRGMTLIPASAVTDSGLSEAVARVAEYMAYRQRASGLFAYQYEPAADAYSEEDNLVRQAGATLAMAFHARHGGSSASRAAADLSIRHHLDGLTEIRDVQHAAFIATPDKRNKLGVTALLCAAMAHHPDADGFGTIRKKLVNGMLWLQRPSGIFLTAFPPAEEVDAQDYFPGEALVALAAEYDREPLAQILDAFDRAVAFYRGYFREAPSPAFVPWQVQAFCLMAKHTKRKDYVDFVFELTDWLAAMQLNESNCPWPELWGGVASYQPGHAGVATASYLEGFTDALRLARLVGDTGRAASYEQAVRGAARFVMQLQVRPEEAYFVRSPKDAVWGIRTTPTLNLLRIDHCQHALIALMKTRQVLFSEAG